MQPIRMTPPKLLRKAGNAIEAGSPIQKQATTNPRSKMLTTIRSPPSSDEFVSLLDHQSQTPDSFFAGKPILHYHVADAKAWIPAEWSSRLPIFPADSSVAPSEPEAAALNGSASDMKEQKVELFVNSECVDPLSLLAAFQMDSANIGGRYL